MLRDNFLVDGEARSVSWEFLEDLLTEILPDMTVEAKGYPVMSLEQMDINNRYPTAGSIFNSVSGQPYRNRLNACGIVLR